jgi:hypothetical protein
MPSPFPGMNPYFEQADHWQDFTEFLTVMRRHLVTQIGPDYIILLEKHVYIHELPPEPRRLLELFCNSLKSLGFKELCLIAEQVANP